MHQAHTIIRILLYSAYRRRCMPVQEPERYGCMGVLPKPKGMKLFTKVVRTEGGADGFWSTNPCDTEPILV